MDSEIFTTCHTSDLQSYGCEAAIKSGTWCEEDGRSLPQSGSFALEELNVELKTFLEIDSPSMPFITQINRRLGRKPLN